MRSLLIISILILQAFPASTCLAADLAPVDSPPKIEPTPSSETRPITFVDETQRQLSEKLSHDWNDYFYIADVSDPAKTDLPALKPWTKNEQDEIKAIIDFTLQRAPGLVLRATSGGKIALCRLKKIPAERTVRGANACSTPRTITFADIFFAQKRKTHGFIHELVHSADCGERTAYSKAWTEFAGPRMAEVKNQLKGDSNVKEIEKTARQTGKLPTLYASTNLEEALAEFVSEYVEGSDFATSQTFIDNIGSGFLSPTTDDLVWLQKFKRARVSLSEKNSTQAASVLEELIKSDRWTPMPYFYLAACLTIKQDYKSALEASGQGLACFDAAAVPTSEQGRLRLLECRAWLFGANRNYLQASKSLAQVLEYDPSNLQDLVDLAWYEEQRGFFSVAAFSYFKANVFDALFTISHSLDARQSKGGDVDSLVSVLKRDVIKCLDKPDVIKLARMAESKLDNRDYDAAQCSCDQALKLEPDAISPRITLIKVYEARGKMILARAEYLKVRKLSDDLSKKLTNIPLAEKGTGVKQTLGVGGKGASAPKAPPITRIHE